MGMGAVRARGRVRTESVMGASFIQSRSGLASYDEARWTAAAPVLSHVVPVTEGIGFLRQVADRLPDHNETIVPATDDHVLLFWPEGTPTLRARLGTRWFEGALAPGAMAWLPAGTPSWWLSDRSAGNVRHLHVSPSALREAGRHEGFGEIRDPLVHIGTVDPAIGDLLDGILAAVDADGEVCATTWSAVALASRMAILRRVARPPTVHRGGLAGWQTRRVIAYMNETLDRGVTIGELAALVDLSPFHFARAFARSTGTAPHRYHVLLRLERARHLLSTTDLPVADVALAIGYGSGEVFARSFRRAFRTTPQSWRRTDGHR